MIWLPLFVLLLASPADDLARARVDTTRIVLKQVQGGLDMYKIQSGSYPTTAQGLKLLVDEKILSKEPKDAWGHALHYEFLDPSTYKLQSWGRDDKPGGTGEDADLDAEP